MFRNTLRALKPFNCLVALLSSAFLGFGLYHVHSFSGVTEGGVLGLTLLLEHWFKISPSISGAVLNVICYALGWRLLGKGFIAYSAIATVGFSLSYKICEFFGPLWPGLADCRCSPRLSVRSLSASARGSAFAQAVRQAATMRLP